MAGWQFHNPVEVRFGRGARSTLADDLSGRRCLLVSSARGRRQMEADPQLGPTISGPEHVWVDGVTTNPDIAWLDKQREQLAGETFDAVVGFGGGSALDSAKTLAVAQAEGLGDVALPDLLGSPLLRQAVRACPLYAVPTTSGTGSEVTPTATIWDYGQRKKLSLAAPAVFPSLAVVDADLTDDLPAEATLTTGLDAVNQAAESVWNRRSTPITEGFATRALALGMPALERLMEDPGDRAARDDMAECSLLAGLAISQTRTALCHSMSYPITAHFGVPHGLACAYTMPAVLRHNLAADVPRFDRLAAALAASDADGLVGEFERFNDRLGVRERVRASVGDLRALEGLAGEMVTPGRADNNLAEVDEAAIRRVLEESATG